MCPCGWWYNTNTNTSTSTSNTSLGRQVRFQSHHRRASRYHHSTRLYLSTLNLFTLYLQADCQRNWGNARSNWNYVKEVMSKPLFIGERYGLARQGEYEVSVTPFLELVIRKLQDTSL